MLRDLRPPHTTVDWATTARDESGQLRVAVRCPGCATSRMELAKSVRKRIHDGIFTGRCRRHRAGTTSATVGEFDHPSVDWQTVTRTRAGLRVQVRCPQCEQSRSVDARAVRQQLRSGRFTGLCRADRLLGKQLPTSQARPHHPSVNWDDWEVVTDGDQHRRRTVTRVTCPQCSTVARYNTAYLVRLIRTDRFSPFCPAHRLADQPHETSAPVMRMSFVRTPALAGP